MTEDDVPDHAPASRGPEPVRLLGANLPADQGLSSLGLIMQLAGSLAAALIAFFGFLALLILERAGFTMVLLLLTTLGVVRSLMHRAAGTSLLYDPRPLSGVRRYIVVALAHSALFSAVLISQEMATMRTAVAIGVALATWPLLLGAILRMPRMRRFEEEVPAPEDKGFEGAAVLMTVLSLGGIGAGLLMLNGFFMVPGSMRGMGVLVMLTMLLLLGRSITHLVAGITGLRNVPLDTAVERVSQYANLGLVSAFVTAGVLLIMVMSASVGFVGVLGVAVMGWLLAIWPTALRRFFAERQFANLLAGDAAPIHRRAPDAGLTALGWLLLAIGAMMVSFAIVAIGGASGYVGDDLVSRTIGPLLWGGAWQTALVGLLQLYAGFELVRMTQHHRITATVASGAIAAIELLMWSPSSQLLAEFNVDSSSASFFINSLLGPLGLALATVVLVNRKIAPMAHATVRR